MTTISQALNGTLALITVGRAIYKEVTKFMDVVQARTGIYGRNIFQISLTQRSRFIIL